MRVARPVNLSPEQRAELERQARGRSLEARLVERSQIVLRAVDGIENQQIAEEMGITPEKAARWRNRFLDGGMEALLKDAARPGRPKTISDRKVKEIVRNTRENKPDNATHWSTRTMAEAATVSEASVRSMWHAHGLTPHLIRTFKISKDSLFAENLKAIVGLCLNPPEHAIVLCVAGKVNYDRPSWRRNGRSPERHSRRDRNTRGKAGDREPELNVWPQSFELVRESPNNCCGVAHCNGCSAEIAQLLEAASICLPWEFSTHRERDPPVNLPDFRQVGEQQ